MRCGLVSIEDVGVKANVFVEEMMMAEHWHGVQKDLDRGRITSGKMKLAPFAFGRRGVYIRKVGRQSR